MSTPRAAAAHSARGDSARADSARAAAADGVRPALPVSRVLVWRHGRTAWNVDGRFQGQLDPPLVETGRREAARAARQMLADGLRADGTVVVSSDLVRAVDTAAALTDLLGVPLRVDARLREHGLGSWEGLTRAEVADRFPEQYADWRAGRPVRGRGGEEPADVVARALAALGDLPRAETAVVVTHSGTAGRLLEALLALGPEHRRVLGPLANCAWSELAVQGPRWRLVRHNVAPSHAADGVEGAPRRGTSGSPEEGAPSRADDAEAAG
ncbi:histidine phosphatase family protein [Geodermatophilus sp. YIM 151500]|uniref:histidine phosphatase family protein n=1 Tax=Geodermatophilus sp. YIM 151500 TaxID=2984531 RepID=UPI0021E3EF71|nr:histidine phosphatase family protein [Geodermatophilus sp. YIM 151500]MCV2491630.1 histidine phosphatase family protein [Geodermatophilus sp. YIM 151500]